jgi:hypothetical protein
MIRLPIGPDDFADDLLNKRGRSEETLPLPEQAPVLAIEPMWTPPEKSEADKARAERRAIVPAHTLSIDDISNDDLVPGLVPKRGIGLIVGRYGTGKSFFGIDWGKRLGSGEEWFGRQLEKIGVVYIAAEAGDTFKRRVLALKPTSDCALGIIFSPIDFGKELSAEVSELSGRIIAANEANMLGAPIKMIFVDTLARSGLKNENDSEAMNNLITNCDMLGEVTGAIVVGIHHAGWAENRSRGHSSLPAAIDFEITISGDDDIRTAEITKSRDGVTGEKMFFRLQPVDVTADISSCIIVPIDAPTAKNAEEPKGVTIADAMLRELSNMACSDTYRKPVQMADGVPPGTYGVLKDTWKQRVLHIGIIDKDGKNPHAQFSQTVSKLVSRQVIRIAGDLVWQVSVVRAG